MNAEMRITIKVVVTRRQFFGGVAVHHFLVRILIFVGHDSI